MLIEIQTGEIPEISSSNGSWDRMDTICSSEFDMQVGTFETVDTWIELVTCKN